MVILGLELHGRVRRRYRKVRAERLDARRTGSPAPPKPSSGCRPMLADSPASPVDRRFLAVVEAAYPDRSRPVSAKEGAALVGVAYVTAWEYIARLRRAGLWPYPIGRRYHSGRYAPEGPVGYLDRFLDVVRAARPDSSSAVPAADAARIAGLSRSTAERYIRKLAADGRWPYPYHSQRTITERSR